MEGGGARAADTPRRTREVVVATTNLDQLGVKAFRGMATVSEMYGSVDNVRQHCIPLKPGNTSREGSQTRRRPWASRRSRR